MAFQFCDRLIHQYRTDGYVIFRRILPAALIRDLRRAAGRAHELARAKGGSQAQRLQPARAYLDEAEFQAFQDYATYAPLVDAIHKVLTPRHTLSNGQCDRLGLLLEPGEHPWCTAWHRDIREQATGAGRSANILPDVEEFRPINPDPLWFNQINCPLYEDNCTWYVPGSYLRAFDLPEEQRAASAVPDLSRTTPNEERERACLEYCQGMPGAIRASMDAGDFMLYHPNGWHLGNYLPDRKRVTLHDWAPSPELVDWYDRWAKARTAKAPANA